MKDLFQIGPSEACVREVADKLNMSESAVSHHIHILRMNGFVRWRRSGNKYFVDLQASHGHQSDFLERTTPVYALVEKHLKKIKAIGMYTEIRYIGHIIYKKYFLVIYVICSNCICRQLSLQSRMHTSRVCYQEFL